MKSKRREEKFQENAKHVREGKIQLIDFEPEICHIPNSLPAKEGGVWGEGGNETSAHFKFQAYFLFKLWISQAEEEGGNFHFRMI